MKEGGPAQRSVVRGEDLVRSSQESLSAVPLNDSRVQVFLARLAFPGDSTAMMRWLEGDEESLSSRFRAFIDDVSHIPAGGTVNIQDTEALKTLLEGVQKHEPERTVH